MVQTLGDPHSSYMDKKTAQQFTQSLDSSFEGIGAEVSMVDGKVTIVAPFKQSPAEKAGLKPNDQILKIDGKSIAGLELNEAVLKFAVKRLYRDIRCSKTRRERNDESKSCKR